MYEWITWGDDALPGAQALVVLLLIAPALEEIVFRAGLQEHLIRAWPQAPAAAGWSNIVTTLVFAVAHLLWRNAWLGLAVIVPAWLIGRLYARHRQLLPCIVLHSGFNGIWVLAAPLGARMLGQASG